MTIGVTQLAVRAAACAAAMWIGWRVFGAIGIVFFAPLLGVAFARPLIELASALRHALRRARWREVEGRHYAYRGHSVRVVEDGAGHRWVRLADVRAIVGFTASDGALALAYPDGWRRVGGAGEMFLGADALVAHLGKERGPESLRLRRWAEREIAFPAERQRRMRSTSDVVE